MIQDITKAKDTFVADLENDLYKLKLCAKEKKKGDCIIYKDGIEISMQNFMKALSSFLKNLNLLDEGK